MKDYLPGVFEIKDFWTNTIWYISLGVISIVMLLCTLLKSKSMKKDIGFLLAVFGLTLIIETVIFIFLRAYEYYPHIIPNSPKNDSVIGNIFSQFSISVVALFVCVFEIPFWGVVLAGTIFYLIENLFLYLGIYQVYWYRPWMTFVGFVILFEFIKRWYKIPLDCKKQKIQYVTVILGVLALYLPTTNWIGILSGLYDIKEDILIDPFISHAVVSIPKYLAMMNIVYFLVRYRFSWIWNTAFIGLVFVIDAILYYTKLLHVRDGWLLIYSSISIATVYLYVIIMKRLLCVN